MMPTLVVGVDPGPTTGIVALAYNDSPAEPVAMILQCNAYSVLFFVKAIYEGHRGYVQLLALEQFVIGNRSGRSGSPGAGRITRDLIGQLTGLGVEHTKILPAGGVKPWATDRKLDAAGLLAVTKGMNHARDAARHALFCAVKQGVTPDPMSKRVVGLR